MADLQHTARSYLALEKKFKELRDSTKEDRKNYKQLKSDLMTLLFEQQKLIKISPKISLGAEEKVFQLGLNKTNVLEGLQTYFDDNDKAQEVYDHLLKNAGEVQRVVFKKIKLDTKKLKEEQKDAEQ